MWWFFLTKEGREYLFEKKNNDIGWLRTIWCRMKGHPYGPWWNSSSLEPDMHCRNCNDDLG